LAIFQTCRAAYTVKFRESSCVTHCFQKKSKAGIATPKTEMEIVRERLKEAEKHAMREEK
jgi:phage-related protein